MKKKVYKIRDKTTGKFVSAGYNRRATWTVYPSAVIDNNMSSFEPRDNFEIVIYEFVESHTEPLR